MLKDVLDNEWFQWKLRRMGCRVVGTRDRGGEVICHGLRFKIIEKDHVPPQKGAALPGYGRLVQEKQLIEVKTATTAPVKEFVIVHELTHGIPGFEEAEAEANLRAFGMAPRGAGQIVKEKGRLKLRSLRERAPEKFEELTERSMERVGHGFEQLAEGGSNKVEDWLNRVFRRGKYKREPWLEDFGKLYGSVDAFSEVVEDKSRGVNRRIDRMFDE